MSNKIYLSIELENILDSLLEFIPLHSDFSLFDIHKNEKLNYENFFIDGLTYNPKTYTDLSIFLLQNGFADNVGDSKLRLSNRGRNLVEVGSLKRFKNEEKSIRSATKRSLWKKIIGC